MGHLHGILLRKHLGMSWFPPPYCSVYVRSVTQSCLALCVPMDCSTPGSYCLWKFSGRNTGVGCRFLLQGIFLTQGSNLSLLYCRQTLYRLCHKGSPNLSVVVDLQRCANLCCTAKWPSYTHIGILFLIFFSTVALINCLAVYKTLS